MQTLSVPTRVGVNRDCAAPVISSVVVPTRVGVNRIARPRVRTRNVSPRVWG